MNYELDSHGGRVDYTLKSASVLLQLVTQRGQVGVRTGAALYKSQKN